jgi:hypothetical protein
MLKFIVMCILFVMASLAYFRLQHHITISSDVIGEAKQKDVAYSKELLLWVMVGSGALVLLCGYDLLYTPGADQFLGVQKCACASKSYSGMFDIENTY